MKSRPPLLVTLPFFTPLAFCQTTRGVAFSNQVLSERTDPNVIPGKAGAEE